MRVNGLTSSATATEAAIGTIMLAVAVFEVTSVSQITTVMKMKRNKATGIASNLANCKPNHSESPLWLNPSASAKPPPSKRTSIRKHHVR